MSRVRNTIIAVGAAAALAAGLSACSDEATTVSDNLSTAADNFKVYRTITIFNGITGEAVLTIKGLCAIEDQGDQLEITCKIAEDGDDEDSYLKHFFGKSDNSFYLVEQDESLPVDPYRTEIMIRPEALLIDPNLETN